MFIIITIHVIACLILIASILLQSGRGSGLSDVFGGGTSQTIFGTRISTFLTRITTTAAVVFLLTCLGLTIFSSHNSMSLLESRKKQPAASKTTEKTPTEKSDKSAAPPESPQK